MFQNQYSYNIQSSDDVDLNNSNLKKHQVLLHTHTHTTQRYNFINYYCCY